MFVQGGLTLNLTKMPLFYSISYFILGELGALFGGTHQSPPFRLLFAQNTPIRSCHALSHTGMLNFKPMRPSIRLKNLLLLFEDERVESLRAKNAVRKKKVNSNCS